VKDDMKRVLVLAAVIVLAAGSTSYAQGTATIAGGPHDLSNGSAGATATPPSMGRPASSVTFRRRLDEHAAVESQQSDGATYQVYTNRR
jgi:hypothetical protein